MTSIIAAIFPALIPLVTVMVLAGAIRLSSRHPARRSPLTRDLMRSPGYSLVIQIENLSERIESFAFTAAVVPVSLYAAYVTQKYTGGVRPGSHMGILYLAVAVGFVAFAAVRLLSLLKERRSLRLGLDCEMAVGQELNGLMCDGYRVFHDVPADGFNIDHVVVGPNGVFAVETKGRSKPDAGRGTADATVIFDGKNLHFPGWIESEPLVQARRQAKWLSTWLSSAIAQPVTAHPVLALPGWFIDRKKWGDVLLLNGKDYRSVMNRKTSTALPDALIQMISHQLDRLCRDVEPQAYRRKPDRWRKHKAA
jgi:hypothetical protein